jgi:hypothetical protein
VFPPGGGRSGHHYQILRSDHEHHQHHHQCVFSLVAAAVSVLLPLLFQQHPFPYPSPGQVCLRLVSEIWPAETASLPATHLVYLD